jgi:hypothetical protein
VTETLPEPTPPQTTHAPADPEAALHRKNIIWGLALFGIVILIFAASIVVALVYLQLD